MGQKDYYILSRIDLAEGMNWQGWLDGNVESEEVIVGIFKTSEGAYEGIMTAVKEHDNNGHSLQIFCSCCGKFASESVVWYDPEKKQLFGANL